MTSDALATCPFERPRLALLNVDCEFAFPVCEKMQRTLKHTVFLSSLHIPLQDGGDLVCTSTAKAFCAESTTSAFDICIFVERMPISSRWDFDFPVMYFDSLLNLQWID